MRSDVVPDPGNSNLKSRSKRSQTVSRPRAPVPSSAASAAIRSRAASSKTASIPKARKARSYWRRTLPSDSDKILRRSAAVSSSQATRTGRRPTNSASIPYSIRSAVVTPCCQARSSAGPAGAAKPIWACLRRFSTMSFSRGKAPLTMNRMLRVLTACRPALLPRCNSITACI